MSYPPTFDTIGQPFILLTSVDSTNNYAMAQAHAGLATAGTAYFALDQTAGKGQRGKSWNSVPGQNIIMSLIVSPAGRSADKTFLLSAAFALGCYDFFKTRAGDEVSIKWPNDIYWRDRKAGGILIENVFGAPGNSWNCSIAGTGININQTEFGAYATRAVSLKQITGKEYEVTELGKELCSFVAKRLAIFYGDDYNRIIAEYNDALFMQGKKVRLKKETAVFETVIQGVDEFGRLHVKDTMQRSFDFGEVVWIFE